MFIQLKMILWNQDYYKICNKLIKMQNIEFLWVTKIDKNIERIESFAKKYEVKLYIIDNDSKSKVDNLNYFLKHVKVKYDYLLISDSGVAIDKNFVSTSLKFFYYKKTKTIRMIFIKYSKLFFK